MNAQRTWPGRAEYRSRERGSEADEPSPARLRAAGTSFPDGDAGARSEPTRPVTTVIPDLRPGPRRSRLGFVACTHLPSADALVETDELVPRHVRSNRAPMQ